MADGYFHGATIPIFASPEELGVMTVGFQWTGNRLLLKGKTSTNFSLNGEFPAVWLEYADNVIFVDASETPHESHPEGIPAYYVFTHLTDALDPDETYYFRAAASDGTRTVYGFPMTTAPLNPNPVNISGPMMVTSLIHRFSKGVYTLEIGVGDFDLDTKNGYDPRTWQNSPPDVDTPNIDNGQE